MKNAATVVFVFLSSCMFSCTPKTIVCQEPGVVITLAGFTNADFSHGTILYRYKKDNAFDSLVDSLKGDYVSPASGNVSIARISSGGYDYKLVLPATNAAYEITAITFGGNKTQSIQPEFLDNRDYVCYMNLASYAVNATTYTSPANNGAPFVDTIFVHK
jgi:hypothetical protein